jgi:hypothetical protein
MPKISESFSYTFKPGTDQWAKVQVEIHEIDTELPLDEQLAQVGDAVDRVWLYLRNQVDAKVEEIFNEAQGGA